MVELRVAPVERIAQLEDRLVHGLRLVELAKQLVRASDHRAPEHFQAAVCGLALIAAPARAFSARSRCRPGAARIRQ